MPTLGDFTKKVYGSAAAQGIQLEPLIYAADRQGLGKCVSAIIDGIIQQYPHAALTTTLFYQHAALVVLKHAGTAFIHSDQDTATQPISVEQGDYYRREPIAVNFVLTDQRLKRFFTKNGINLQDYGIEDASQYSR